MNRKTYLNIFTRISGFVLVCLTMGLLASCGSSGSNIAPKTIINITAGSGSPQSAQVSTAFAAPLVANVTSNGTALKGATVTFAAPASSSGASCALSATSATTDSSGNASVTCTANTTAGGPYNVTASTSGATATASFALTNTAAPPPTILITPVSGYTTTAVVGSPFSALSATVTSNGAPASGVSVTFTAPSTGASGLFATPTPAVTDTETTNSNGIATSQIFTANLVTGAYSVTASTSGAATPASFALTNTAVVPPAMVITATSGGGQSAIVTTAFAGPLVATVTNGGNPVSGVSVTFTAPASGASGTFATTPPATTDTEVTGANGQATSHTFTANSTAGGPYNVVASSGTLTPVNFAETNTAGAAANLNATSGGGQSAAISTLFTLPLVATVTDAHGNPVSGVSVAFAAPASGASCVLSAPAATTVANGTASVTCTANTTAGGPYNVVASSTGLASVNFALTNTAGAPAHLTATSGGGQSATVSTAFASPLVATVTDSNSNPVSGVTVTFTAPASGASATFATTPASTTDTEVTGATGQAISKAFTANSTVGGYNVVVTSGTLASFSFPETNILGSNGVLTATSGGGQSTAIATAFASPLVATVTSGGNPVSGVSVTFTAPTSGASCVLSATSATTNASGSASVTCTANTTVGGPYNVVASSTGLSSVNFALTNTVGVPASLAATSGGGQSATVSTAFASPLVATVTDAHSNPVSGVSVTFTAPASGASATFGTVPPSTTDTEVTGANGQATSHIFTANSTVGGYNVAVSSGTLTPVNFPETNILGGAGTLTATSGGGQSTAITTAFANPLVATVTNGGNPVSGVSVTFTAPTSGASCVLSATSGITNAGGTVSVTCTANTTVGGPYNVVASSTGLASVNFAETNTAGPAANLTATSGGGQSATVSTAFALPLVATVTDAHGNPVSGTAVAFTSPASGASGLFATTPPSTVDVELTGSNGQATSKSFGANATAGTYNVVATSGTLTPVNFAETNTANANILTATSGGGQATKIVTAFPHPLVATVTNGGNPVSGVAVTFTAPASGASGLFDTLPSPSTTDTELTGANGQATSQVFGANSTAGTYNVVATSGTSTPVNFSETNTAGTATVLTATGGAGQSATVGTAFASPLVATATDSHGNTVSGVSVTFTAPASGASGTFANTPPSTTDTEVTGSNGQATSKVFTANSTAGGPYNVVASASGTTSASFAETNTASSGETLAATSGGGQSATINSPFALPLVATVTNAGVPVSGVSVTFTAPASGASGLFATTPPSVTDTEVTGANGQATSHVFGANTTAGTYNVVASSSGLTSVNFAETNNAGAAATLTATSGGGQSAVISTAFALPLVATVTDAHSNPVSGVSVTFTAPASGASGTFGTTPPAITDTEVTGSNGQATSKTFTANATLGGYTVVASSGSLAHANFAETNTVVGASSTYVFYASGEDTYQGLENYYAIAGAVTIDSNGNVTAGEQDYNDGNGDVSPGEPAADIITGGTLTVNPTTGQGTLTLITNNTGVGSPAGTEVFAVQFANTKHALIAEFDGWATSSGSLDLQTATTASGNFAFALSGVDQGYNSVAYGGVYSISGGTANGILDINDNGDSQQTGVAFTSTSTTPDAFGRSTVSGITNSTITPASSIVLASYVVGPEVVRLIDIDNGNGTTAGTYADAAVGSAYGQGSTTTFTNATFPSTSSSSGVFTLLGQWSEAYATLGEFTADATNKSFSAGTADDNELDNGILVTAASIASSTYNFVGTAANGYGSMTLDWNGATSNGSSPSVGLLGVYMVDPKLNINDPNNTTSADVGGALVIDLVLAGGMGVITPQTNTTVAKFSGTYVAGFQNFNDFNFTCYACELDMVSQGTMTSGAALSLTGDDSDPFGTWTGTPAQSAGDTFTSTPFSAGTGIYSMSSGNTIPNPLEATINAAAPFGLNVDIYQASGSTLYWIDVDPSGLSVFLGPIEEFTGAPTLQPAEETQPQPNTNVKPTQGLGGTSH